MGKKLNLNDASVEDITANIPGINKDTAEAIVHYRNNNGTIVNIYDLHNIYGFDAIEKQLLEKAEV